MVDSAETEGKAPAIIVSPPPRTKQKTGCEGDEPCRTRAVEPELPAPSHSAVSEVEMTPTQRLKLRGLTAIALAGLALAPARAIAQSLEAPTPSARPDSGLGVRIGQTVWVTTVDGLRRRGTVARVTREAIEITSNGQSVVLPAPKVAKIQVWDSPLEGAVGGAIGGAIFGYLVAGPGCLDDDKCNGWTGALAFGALFAAMGAGIDALTFRRVIYDTPGGNATFTLSPLAARRGLGARVALEWKGAREVRR